MLKSRTSQIVAALGLIGIIVAGGLAFAFLRPPEEASAPISSIPIEVEDTEDSAEPAEDPTLEPQEDAGAATQGVVTFEIVQAESEVRFTLGEVLRGQDNVVVGITNQVAGQILIDFEDPSTSQVGTILVNARTLATDSNMRDRAIKNRVLETNTYEFITFTPTVINGWPETVVVGETIELEMVGDLTIKDVTLEVTFTLSVVAVSETRLEGISSTIVIYADYGITIPDVPVVASVDDEVRLVIEFVAVAVE